MKIVVVSRSRFFAYLAFFLLAMVAGLTAEHCACDQVSTDCEHAGEVCSQPIDCSDCLIDSTPVALGTTATFLPPAKSVSTVCIVPTLIAYVGRFASDPTEPTFCLSFFACRPPALRTGTMCLRI
ncbi:MAG: hypothetical protein JHC77_05040 [Opitutales bacterium]|jgi:hypothetical protein|nr:hypothetical protein [Opitutales bacterium]